MSPSYITNMFKFSSTVIKRTTKGVQLDKIFRFQTPNFALLEKLVHIVELWITRKACPYSGAVDY
jgi:hypothetical protein